MLLSAKAIAQESDFKGRFIGTWKADKEKTKKYNKEHEDAQSMPDELLDGMPSITLKVAESGDASVNMEDGSGGTEMNLEGSWKLEKEVDESHAEVTINMVVDGQDDPKTCTAELLDDDTLVLGFEDEPVLVFTRAKEDAKDDGEKDDDNGDDGGDK
jgi:hypothetical protein